MSVIIKQVSTNNVFNDKKIIIMEGHDLAGKSTIARACCRIYGFQYFKHHGQAKHFKENNFLQAMKYEMDYFIDFLQQVEIESGIIIDRCTPSEFAYSHAFERETDEEYLIKVDEEFSKLGAIIIYCYKDKIINYEDHLIPESKIEKIKEGYEKYFNLTKMPVLKLNTTDENLYDQINAIKNFIKLH